MQIRVIIVAVLVALVACKTDKETSTSAVGSGSVRSAKLPPTTVVNRAAKLDTRKEPKTLPMPPGAIPDQGNPGWVIKPDMSMVFLGPFNPPIFEGAISSHEFTNTEHALLEEMDATQEKIRAAHAACKAALVERVGSIDEQVDWTFGLRLVGDGQRMRIAEVRVVEDFWPSFFNEDDKRCWMAPFENASFASKRVYDQVVDYGLCVKPTTEGTSK